MKEEIEAQGLAEMGAEQPIYPQIARVSNEEKMFPLETEAVLMEKGRDLT